jgi:hypothetical protein
MNIVWPPLPTNRLSAAILYLVYGLGLFLAISGAIFVLPLYLCLFTISLLWRAIWYSWQWISSLRWRAIWYSWQWISLQVLGDRPRRPPTDEEAANLVPVWEGRGLENNTYTISRMFPQYLDNSAYLTYF